MAIIVTILTDAAESGLPNDGISSLVLEISDTYLASILPNHLHCAFRLDAESPSYESIIKILYDLVPVVESNSPYKDFFIISKINEILYILYEYCQVPIAHSQKGYSKEVIHFVGEHYPEHISLDTMANFVGLQKNYFCKKFKEETGIPFKHYLSRIRLDAALSLLASKKGNSVECALQSGFASEKVFIEWCKKIYGTTPTQYIKR